MAAIPVFRLALTAALVLVVQPVMSQTPALRYDKPSGFMGGGGDVADTYSSVNADGLISVYPFQAFQGDFRRSFLSSLFSQRIESPYRETQLLGQPMSDTVSVPGADQTLAVRFVADHSGYRREHARLAILAGGAVALVDISSSSPEAWQRNWPGAMSLIQSLRVSREPAQPKPIDTRAGSKVAGLYLGSALVFQGNPSGPPGSGTWVAGSRWFLLAPDGRVQRGLKLPQAPGGDLRQFDYDAARRRDPTNAGSYTVEGTRVTLRMTGSGTEIVTGELTADGDLLINGTPYRRSWPKSP